MRHFKADGEFLLNSHFVRIPWERMQSIMRWGRLVGKDNDREHMHSPPTLWFCCGGRGKEV